MIILRKGNPGDGADYARLQNEVFLIKPMGSDHIVEFYSELLETEGRLNFVISDEATGDYCGQCSVKDIRVEKPEIEIELLEKYQGRGIGFAALSRMMQMVSISENVPCFFATVEPDNIASQKLMYKLGGVPAGISRSGFLRGDQAEDFEREYLGLIDDKTIAIANMYNTNPQKLLSCELVIDISFPLKPPTFRADFAIDDSRKLGLARRNFSTVKFAAKAMEMLKNADESSFEEVKAEIEKMLI